MYRILCLFGVILLMGTVAATGTSRQQEKPRVVHYVRGIEISKVLLPDDQLVAIYKIQSPPPVGPTLTLQDELQRLGNIASAIAVVDVKSVEGSPTSIGDWAVTKVRGTIRDLVKSSERVNLAKDDGTVEFEFDGGELAFGKTIVRVGEYPLLSKDERYLVMFQLDPMARRWYPFQPFRIDNAGRLRRVAFFRVEPLIFETPLDGQLLTDVVRMFQKQ